MARERSPCGWGAVACHLERRQLMTQFVRPLPPDLVLSEGGALCNDGVLLTEELGLASLPVVPGRT